MADLARSPLPTWPPRERIAFVLCGTREPNRSTRRFAEPIVEADHE